MTIPVTVEQVATGAIIALSVVGSISQVMKRRRLNNGAAMAVAPVVAAPTVAAAPPVVPPPIVPVVSPPTQALVPAAAPMPAALAVPTLAGPPPPPPAVPPPPLPAPGIAPAVQAQIVSFYAANMMALQVISQGLGRALITSAIVPDPTLSNGRRHRVKCNKFHPDPEDGIARMFTYLEDLWKRCVRRGQWARADPLVGDTIEYWSMAAARASVLRPDRKYEFLG